MIVVKFINLPPELRLAIEQIIFFKYFGLAEFKQNDPNWLLSLENKIKFGVYDVIILDITIFFLKFKFI